MSTHTPGPWELDGLTVQPANEASFDGCNICRVTVPSDLLEPQAIANGHLLVAAPDLLAACKRALTFQTTKNLLGEENRAASLLDTLNMLRGAIAKAEGKK
jgi:hypothetical protein